MIKGYRFCGRVIDEINKTDAERYLLQMGRIRAFEEKADKNCIAGEIHGTIICNFVLIMGKRFDLFGFRIMKYKLVHV
jgi:hypothetical protein